MEKKNDTSQKGAMLAILVIVSIVALVMIVQKVRAPIIGADLSGQATAGGLYETEQMMKETGLAALSKAGVSNPSVVSSVSNGKIKVTFYHAAVSPELMVVAHQHLSDNLPDSIGIYIIVDKLELTYPREAGVEEENLAGLTAKKPITNIETKFDYKSGVQN
ncbi:hypothetical protein JW968_07175 [Candidatus Woesearchaeota archaeon]|nr:hypothetical protein [Candidatus Woesearchaeota archaeon]